MGTVLQALLIGGSDTDENRLGNVLREVGYQPLLTRVDSRERLVAALNAQAWHVVVIDEKTPDFDVPAALELLKQHRPNAAVVLISNGSDDEPRLAHRGADAGGRVPRDQLPRLGEVVVHQMRRARRRRRLRHWAQTIRDTTRDLEIAHSIQSRLYPANMPRIDGFDIAGAAYPAEAAGGDYFDFIPLDRGGLVVGIGDVSGHGIGPALLMAELHAYIRALAITTDDLNDLLLTVNRLLNQPVAGDRFITLLLGRLEPHDKIFTYVSAAHQGYLLDGAGTIKTLLESTSLPLGILPDLDVGPPSVIRLETGDTILLMTDGVDEAAAPDGTPFGISRAIEVLRIYRHLPADQMVSNLFHAVRAFTQNKRQRDDITAVVVKVVGNSAAQAA